MITSCLEGVFAKLGCVAPPSADTLPRLDPNTDASFSEVLDVRTYFANTPDKKQRAQCVRAFVELFHHQYIQSLIVLGAVDSIDNFI